MPGVQTERGWVKVGERVYLCGTRAVVRTNHGWAVVCATCGKAKAYRGCLGKAIAIATDHSDRACECGAR